MISPTNLFLAEASDWEIQSYRHTCWLTREIKIIMFFVCQWNLIHWIFKFPIVKEKKQRIIMKLEIKPMTLMLCFWVKMLIAIVNNEYWIEIWYDYYCSCSLKFIILMRMVHCRILVMLNLLKNLIYQNKSQKIFKSNTLLIHN